MATLKATVKTKLKSGAYIVYIRIVHNRQSSFFKTPWMVRDDGVSAMVRTWKILSFVNRLLNLSVSTTDCLIWLTALNGQHQKLHPTLRRLQRICHSLIMQDSISRNWFVEVKNVRLAITSGHWITWKDSPIRTTSCSHVWHLLSLTDGLKISKRLPIVVRSST